MAKGKLDSVLSFDLSIPIRVHKVGSFSLQEDKLPFKALFKSQEKRGLTSLVWLGQEAELVGPQHHLGPLPLLAPPLGRIPGLRPQAQAGIRRLTSVSQHF